MGFSEHRRALTDAAFAMFGDAAEWTGHPEPVTIRMKSRDEDERFGQVRIVDRSTVIRVRSWEVASPRPGNIVTIVSGPKAGRYVVASGSMVDAKGVWDCPVEVAP